MKADPTVREFAELPLSPTAGQALYRQIYERIRDAILGGTLSPGSRLPSSRSLASQLGVSRGTVEIAYEVLVGEGYLVGQGAAGTRVDPQLDRQVLGSARHLRSAPAHGAQATSTRPWPHIVQPFQMGQPAMDAFPRKLWSRLAVQCARGLATAAMVYQDPAGYLPLRQALVHYLAIARGIDCTVDQVCITAGFQTTLALITRLLLQPGDTVWIEDPGYFQARRALLLADASLAPVPVDAEGMDVAAGIARAPRARLAVVTPSHQSPLGVTLSLQRRLALLAWAARSNAWIVEDDYDSEFRYQGRPLPALQSLDQAGRVLYVGTFSKVLFPGLRLGYLVVPDTECKRFRQAVTLFAPSPAPLEQAIVTEFFTQGHFGRHIKRMRQLYAERRAALARELTNTFGDRMRVDLQAGGMHLLAQLDSHEEDFELVKRARAHDLAPAALSSWVIEADCAPGMLLSFTNIPVGAAGREVRRLQRALDG